VDAVIISGDGMQKELFYVAASRGRENLVVVTSDKERLRESVAHSTARKSASELARQQRPVLHQGTRRGRALARELIKRATLAEAMPEKPSLPPVIRNRPMERSHDRGVSR
jgi:hypothetical protein